VFSQIVAELSFTLEGFVGEQPFQRQIFIGTTGAMVGVSSSIVGQKPAIGCLLFVNS
jgi:hypothetical protein